MSVFSHCYSQTICIKTLYNFWIKRSITIFVVLRAMITLLETGYSYDPDCVYVNGTGRDYYEYLIKLNRCGTLGASNHVEGRREPSVSI